MKMYKITSAIFYLAAILAGINSIFGFTNSQDTRAWIWLTVCALFIIAGSCWLAKTKKTSDSDKK